MADTISISMAGQTEVDGTMAQPLIGETGALFNLANHHTQSIFKTHAEQLAQRVAEIDALTPELVGDGAAEAFGAYVGDVMQRSVLFLDLLRERGNSFIAREKEGFKPVLAFSYEMVCDGRTRSKPVNYAVVRITPPKGFPPQQDDKRPFIIIDPRAGHGAGIGGSKIDSEVGVALRDGHPVYFVVFFTHPEPNQTLGDVRDAESEFIIEIRRRHPNAPAPLTIGNCQGGWATMILAAKYPQIMGPIIIAGAPLSYWAGEVGKNPMRYLGGLSGGSVPALLACDLGNGKFDGAGLISNFEQLNPAKTMFRKYYDAFSDPDKKGGEFLSFEEWWSGFYYMNEAEIRWIVENLFIGNKLTRGEAILNGEIIDLTRISSPVIVFASHGDNITPPPQALNWIADLYLSVEEIRARGHVIIYTLHDSIGHLGIFVSAKVASKEHRELSSVIKTIEALQPGLYEMMIAGEHGNFEVAFESRSIADMLSHDDGREDEQKFAAVAKVSEWAAKSYEVAVRPAIKPWVTQQSADALAAINPIRQRRYVFSDRNPYMEPVAKLADEVRNNRLAAADGNPFLRFERLQADLVEQSINLFRDTRDAMLELTFHAVYGSPWMRAIAAANAPPQQSHDVVDFPEVKAIMETIGHGGYPEAIVRMLVQLARARGSISRDRLERTTRILFSRPPFDSMEPARRVAVLKEQTIIVELDPERALKTLPKLLHDDVDRIRAVDVVFDIAGVASEMDPATIEMFKAQQRVLLTLPSEWYRRPAAAGLNGGHQNASEAPAPAT